MKTLVDVKQRNWLIFQVISIKQMCFTFQNDLFLFHSANTAMDGRGRLPGKTAAQRQREYRLRKIEREGDEYRKKEAQRVRGYYVKAADMTKSKLKDFREKNKKKMSQYRLKKSMEEITYANQDHNTANETPVHTLGESVHPTAAQPQPSTSSNKMIVRMPFVSPTRKRIRVSRAVSKLNRKVHKLEEELKRTKRSKKTFQKRWERLAKKAANQKCGATPEQSLLPLPQLASDGSNTPPMPTHKVASSAGTSPTAETPHCSTSPQTPRSQTVKDIRQAGITPRKLPRPLRRQLLYANTVQTELAKAAAHSKTHRRIVTSLVTGNILKRSRMKKRLSVGLGLSQRALRKANDHKSIVDTKKKRLPLIRQRLQEHVLQFLLRDDHSRQNPGKRDYVTVNGERKQTRILNDYLHNLFDKFRAEEPTIKVCRAVFYTMRPKYILLSSFLKSSNCLCQIHQNCALLLRALKRVSHGEMSLSPDNFIKQHPDSNSIHNLLSEIPTDAEVSFDQWKRVKLDEKFKNRIVSQTLKRDDFIEKAKEQIVSFRCHAARVKTQYIELKKLKDNLPADHIIIQMDFAENYSCSESSENVQSSYWNKTGVTLHPCVVYSRDSTEENLQHKSYVYISDVLHHNSAMVLAILKILIKKDLQVLIQRQHIKKIHYITDSPFSPYRNKFMFHLLVSHHEMFGVDAVWDYFETGHGKGPCDGVGGSVKRMADQATRQGKCITDARTFYDWAVSTDSAIYYTFVSEFDYTEADKEVKEIQPTLVEIKGTGKLHAVRKGPNKKVFWRETSCNCTVCVSEEEPTCQWNTAPPYQQTKSAPAAKCDVCHHGVCACIENVGQVAAEQIGESASEVNNPQVSSERNGDSGSEQTTVPNSLSNKSTNFAPIDSYVIASYGQSWYVSKVLEVDEENEDVMVTACGPKERET